MDCQLLHQKVRQRISVIPENWHFNSFKLPKWIFWETIFEIWEDQCLFFLCFHYWDLMSNNWRFIIVIVKGLYLRLFADIFDLIIDDPFLTLQKYFTSRSYLLLAKIQRFYLSWKSLDKDYILLPSSLKPSLVPSLDNNSLELEVNDFLFKGIKNVHCQLQLVVLLG